MSEAIAKLADEVIEALKPRLAAEMLKVAAQLKADEPDPLLAAPEVGKELGVSETTARLLMQSGEILTAPGLTEKRCRRSEVRKYATSKQP